MGSGKNPPVTGVIWLKFISVHRCLDHELTLHNSKTRIHISNVIAKRYTEQPRTQIPGILEMRKQRSKDIKENGQRSHWDFCRKDLVWEMGTTMDHVAFSPSHSPSLMCLALPLVKEFPVTKPPAPQEKFYLGAFTGALYLGIIVDVTALELMSFTGSFPCKSKNGSNSTPVDFFLPQLMYIFLSKGICFMHKLASALFMLNLCNQYNNERNDS